VQDAKADKTSTGPESGREASPATPGDAEREPVSSARTSADATSEEEAPVESGTIPTSDSAQLRNLALFIPRMLQLIGRLVTDPEVPLLDKVILAAAAAYVVSPLDILPDAVPLLGQLDDIYLIAICLLRLMHRSGEAKLRQHWDGPEDIVQILHNVTDIATRYLPGKVRTYLRNWVESKPPA